MCSTGTRGWEYRIGTITITANRKVGTYSGLCANIKVVQLEDIL